MQGPMAGKIKSGFGFSQSFRANIGDEAFRASQITIKSCLLAAVSQAKQFHSARVFARSFSCWAPFSLEHVVSPASSVFCFGQ